MGHPGGGRHTYCSLAGRYDWQKAWLTSALFSFLFTLVARLVIRRSSAWERTGAKQSLFDQLWGSRLPRATIRYLARIGFPSPSRLMVEMAMVGRALPLNGKRRLYSSSLITSHVSRLSNPLYSSR